MIPAKRDALFVYSMEVILDLYKSAYDPRSPLISLDEKSFQLLENIKEPLPFKTIERIDYQYKRNGVCNIFMAFEPLRGHRVVEVTAKKTKREFASFLKRLIEEWYPEAESLRIIMDNYATHHPKVLYEFYPAPLAHKLSKKLRIYYTPVHASWLNAVECELSVLERQCLNCRIATLSQAQAHIQDWTSKKNEENTRLNWQFTVEDARIKLKSLYPEYISKSP